jgi:hypothetical protein
MNVQILIRKREREREREGKREKERESKTFPFFLQERRKIVLPYTPSMDNESSNPFFPKPLDTLINHGVKVPFLVGYNNDEGIFLMDYKFIDRKYIYFYFY